MITPVKRALCGLAGLAVAIPMVVAMPVATAQTETGQVLPNPLSQSNDGSSPIEVVDLVEAPGLPTDNAVDPATEPTTDISSDPAAELEASSMETSAVTDTSSAELSDGGAEETDELTETSGEPAESADASESATPESPATDESALTETDSGFTVLTAPMAVSEFYVAGVVWDEGPAPDSVEIRVLEGETWSEWYLLEIDVDAEMDGRPGTEPYVAAEATGIQARIAGDTVPTGLELMLISGTNPAQEEISPELTEVEPAVGTEDEDAINAVAGQTRVLLSDSRLTPAAPDVSPTTFAQSTSIEMLKDRYDTCAMQNPTAPVTQRELNLNITTRAEWGAGGSKVRWNPCWVELRGAVVHHTATTNSYTENQVPSIVRSIYNYHAVVREWGDIGYNFLIDKFGNVYEGREGTMQSPSDEMAIGGHAAPANTYSMGISVIGDYSNIRPSDVVLKKITDIIVWRFDLANVDPRGQWSLYANKGTYPAIVGHQEVSLTACPANIQSYIRNRSTGANGQIVTSVANQVNLTDAVPGGSLETAVLRLAELAKFPGGDPNYRGQSIYKSHVLGSTVASVQDFGPIGKQLFVGNIFRSGDLPLYRDGKTFYFATSAARQPQVTTRIIGRVGDEVFIGDFNGDGRDGAIIRRGNVLIVLDDLTTGVESFRFTYGRTGDEILIMDWDGDGVDEVVVRRGKEFHLRSTLTSGKAQRIIHYGRDADEAFAGDWNGDGTDTFAIRRGSTLYVRNSNTTGIADRTFTFGQADQPLLVGDWNRDGRDTFAYVSQLP